jgi:hypothetical protein
LAKEITSLHNERTDSDSLDSKDATGTVSLPLPEDENSQGVEQLDKAPKQAPQTTAALQNVQALTDAFIQVRYAQVPVAAAEVSRLQQLWEQIKRQLSL